MESIFFQQAGIKALGSRIKQLSELITQDGKSIYKLEQLNFEPRWFPVFYMLSEYGSISVSKLAESIGQSHVAVSQVATELKKAGLIEKNRDTKDGRKSILSLSKNGGKLQQPLSNLYQDVHAAVDELLSETEHNLWAAIQDLELALDQKSLLKRVQSHRKNRLSKQIEIVDYHPKYAKDFRDINIEWIQEHFDMEEADFKSLDHPDTYYIQRGGYIFVALFEQQVAGVIAMTKMENHSYELSKMGVRPIAQGKGVGWLLCQTVINKAVELKAKRLFLESNTVLQPAIRLYYKLGFQKINTHLPSPYARSNIQMEILF